MSQIATLVEPSTDMEVLRHLNLNYIRSVEQSDVSWFDENLSNDFLNTNPDGTVLDRAGFLAQIAQKSSVTDITGSDVRIRVIENAGVVNARTHFTKPDGSRGYGCYTDVYLKSGGRWRCISAHVSRS